jgi:putative transposase
MESEVVKGTKKIRFYPKNPKHLLEMLRQSRRAYNLAASCFAETDVHRHLRDSEDLKKTPLRKLIREYVKSEVEERQAEFVSSSCDESVLAAFLTRDAIIRQRKNGFAAKFSFKSLKDVKQTFILQRLSQGFVDKQMLLTERLPKECISRTTTFSFERGQWFICAQILIVTKAQGEIQAQRIVALDPGVRTFQTAYSIDQCTSYGQSFYTDKVFPLLLRIDKLLGMRAKSKHAQWKLHFSKRIDKAMWRVKNLINDLHRRIAHDLTKSFDVILLPTFETQEMSKKSSRKLHTKTVRSMLGLAHYRFQLHLKWMCKKLGKTLVLVNEAYTSKTESWSGIIHSKLGGAKTISDQKILVDRDINGARGIMLRSLYGSLFPEQETPNVSLVSF